MDTLQDAHFMLVEYWPVNAPTKDYALAYVVQQTGALAAGLIDNARKRECRWLALPDHKTLVSAFEILYNVPNPYTRGKILYLAIHGPIGNVPHIKDAKVLLSATDAVRLMDELDTFPEPEPSPDELEKVASPPSPQRRVYEDVEMSVIPSEDVPPTDQQAHGDIAASSAAISSSAGPPPIRNKYDEMAERRLALIQNQENATDYEPPQKRPRTEPAARPGIRQHAYDSMLSAQDLGRGLELPPAGEAPPVEIDRQGVRIGERDRCFHFPDLSKHMSDYTNRREALRIATLCIGEQAMQGVSFIVVSPPKTGTDVFTLSLIFPSAVQRAKTLAEGSSRPRWQDQANHFRDAQHQRR